MSEDERAPRLYVTASGVIHTVTCHHIRGRFAMRWRPLPGDRACSHCQPAVTLDRPSAKEQP